MQQNTNINFFPVNFKKHSKNKEKKRNKSSEWNELLGESITHTLFIRNFLAFILRIPDAEKLKITFKMAKKLMTQV